MGPLGHPKYDEMTPTALVMRDAGRITSLGLAKSLLESGTSHFPYGAKPVRGLALPGNARYLRTEELRQFQGPRSGRPNLPLRYLARGLALGSHRNWSDEIVDLGERAKVLLDGLAHLDESLEDQQFVVYHDGNRYRLAPFGAFDRFKLHEVDGGWIARANAIQTHSSALVGGDVLEELEELMNANAPELAFQRFFEMHPELLTALGPYTTAHPQVILRHDDGHAGIPDFFLERLDTGFSDLLELKRPSVELVRRQPKRTRFGDAVMEAVAQLEQYRDHFEDRRHRDQFREQFGLQAYRPRAVVVIGRRRSFNDELERVRLESRLPSWLALKTYDDVYAEVDRWRSFVSEA
ncbi:MAG: hypothetical protein QOI31_1766 [Solirubrobacterales bacterium]|jgi:hypothetical protein|nr:hypothetical protein [Solirubrobacterales bacterium]